MLEVILFLVSLAVIGNIVIPIMADDFWNVFQKLSKIVFVKYEQHKVKLA